MSRAHVKLRKMAGPGAAPAHPATRQAAHVGLTRAQEGQVLLLHPAQPATRQAAQVGYLHDKLRKKARCSSCTLPCLPCRPWAIVDQAPSLYQFSLTPNILCIRARTRTGDMDAEHRPLDVRGCHSVGGQLLLWPGMGSSSGIKGGSGSAGCGNGGQGIRSKAAMGGMLQPIRLRVYLDHSMLEVFTSTGQVGVYTTILCGTATAGGSRLSPLSWYSGLLARQIG